MNKSLESHGVALLADAFAQQCVSWAKNAVQERGSEPSFALLATLARRLIFATHEGHVCLDLTKALSTDLALKHVLGPDDSALCEILLSSGVIATPTTARGHPLILEGHRLYLARHYVAENMLALRLTELSASGRLCVISGGPGTGKTTTIARLLGRLINQAPNLHVVLAAPTGKAAARMMEALLARSASLSHEARACLPKQATTLHRLLGIQPNKPQPLHRPDNPLWLDLLIVDEASMLNLTLATQLLNALPPHAAVILLGDKDQLAAVEAGAVFAEISANAVHAPTDEVALDHVLDSCLSRLLDPSLPSIHHARGLSEGVIWLRTSYRFKSDSALGRLAAAVRDGDIETTLSHLSMMSSAHISAYTENRQGQQTGECFWINDPEDSLSSVTQDILIAGFSGYRTALMRWLEGCCAADEVAGLFSAFDQFRILAATHQGPRGTRALNLLLINALQRWVGMVGAIEKNTLGRPILILENAPTLGLFNGDTGLLLPSPEGEVGAYFSDNRAGRRGFRVLPLSLLPRHETAFALSVHKSQGSEFDRVALLFPQAPSPVLTRELLYTGLTRARHGVTVIASEQRLCDAIASPTRRDSGLAARLWQEKGR